VTEKWLKSYEIIFQISGNNDVKAGEILKFRMSRSPSRDLSTGQIISLVSWIHFSLSSFISVIAVADICTERW
jgi:hypothetical protein